MQVCDNYVPTTEAMYKRMMDRNNGKYTLAIRDKGLGNQSLGTGTNWVKSVDNRASVRPKMAAPFHGQSKHG